MGGYVTISLGFPLPLLIKKHTPREIGQLFLGKHGGGLNFYQFPENITILFGGIWGVIFGG